MITNQFFKFIYLSKINSVSSPKKSKKFFDSRIISVFKSGYNQTFQENEI